MQAPPPYSSSGKKKSNVGLIIGLVIAGVALCCLLPVGFIGKMGFDVFKKSTGMVGCISDIDAMRKGAIAYSKKHGGKLPPATNWKKELAPFLEQPIVPPPMKAPTLESGLCDPDVPTSIAYNTAVAGKKVADLEDDENAVVFFEVPGSIPDASEKYAIKPFNDSPKIIANQPRGWIAIGMSGDGYILNKNGVKARVATTSTGGVKVETKQ